MSLYSKLWWYPNGDPAAGVRALVFLEDQSTLAELFADPGFSVPLSNPTATDANGLLAFFVQDGNYWIYVGDDFSGESELAAVSPFVTGAVLSVNGQTGVVFLDSFDVGAQPADVELTQLAAISAANDDIIQRKAGVWTNRTVAQYKADQAYTPAEIGAIGNAIMDAKGDLISATAPDIPVRVGVGADGTFLRANSATASGLEWGVPSGGGDVTGPASSTDNAITRFDGLTGKIIQNSPITVSDTGTITIPAQSAPLSAAGQLFYDSVMRTLVFDNDDPNVRMPIGRQVWIEGFNDSGGAYAKGQAVHIDNHQLISPFLPILDLSQANDGTTSEVIGLVMETIPNGQSGFVLIQGVLSGLNMTGFVDGDYVYLSATTPGGLTPVPPHQPNWRNAVGVVASDDAVNGAILVFPSESQIGFGTTNQYLALDTAGNNQMYRSLVGTAGRLTVTHSSTAATFDVDPTLSDSKVDKATLAAKGSLISASAPGVPVNLPVGANGQILRANSATSSGLEWVTDATTGDVTGPASATDNALARYDGITGKIIQNSGVTLSDAGTLTIPGQVAIPPVADGQLYNSSNYKTLVFDNTDPDGTLIIGRQTFIEVRNETGSSISKGAPVYVTNHQEVFPYPPTVALAQANTAATSRCIGLAAHNIENNTNGYVVIEGMLHTFPTVGFNHGDYLYVSPSVAGGLTNTRPASPNFAVPVAIVAAVDISHGSLTILRTEFTLGFGTANQVRGMNAAGTGEEYKTLQGTAGRLDVTHGVGTVTFDVSNTVLNTKTDKATLTAKGSIYAATSPGVPADLPVGTNNQYLMANSATATGLQWDTITPSDIGAVPTTRLINTINGLQGGGDLTADRTFSPVYGSTANTVAQGNDTRIVNAIQGPASATDEAIVRYDATTGKLAQNSNITINDAGSMFWTSQVGIPLAPGQLAYSDPYLTFVSSDNESLLPLGSQTRMYARNNTGVTISAGQAVYINGHQDGAPFAPTVALARADAEATAACIGFAAHDIENATFGWVQVKGIQTFTSIGGPVAGSPVYLSATTAGAFTATEPSAPNLSVRLGEVARNGGGPLGIQLFVRPEPPAQGVALNGQIEVTRSGAPLGTQMQTPRTYAIFPSGSGYSMTGGVHTVRTSALMTLNQMLLTPFALPTDRTLTLMSFEVTIATGSSLVRGGIYAADPATGRPTGSPIADFGTIATSGALGIRSFVLGVALTPGIYYMAMAAQTAAPGIRFASGFSPYVQPATFPTGTGLGFNNAWAQAGVAGALPAIGALTDAVGPVCGVIF